MARCIEVALAIALLASGCFSGHLLDAARRREQVLAFREAVVTDDALLVRYAAIDVDDKGRRVDERERWAAIPLADVRAGDRPIDTLAVEWPTAADARRRGGRPLRLAGAPAPAPAAEVVRDGGRDVALILHETAGPAPALDARAFTRLHTRPWVWPLLPLTLAVDAVGTPALLLFAPAVIVVGD